MCTLAFTDPLRCQAGEAERDRAKREKKKRSRYDERENEKARKDQGEWERGEKVSRERKERGFQRPAAESHLQLSFSFYACSVFLVLCLSISRTRLLHISFRLIAVCSPAVSQHRMGRCLCTLLLPFGYVCDSLLFIQIGVNINFS